MQIGKLFRAGLACALLALAGLVAAPMLPPRHELTAALPGESPDATKLGLIMLARTSMLRSQRATAAAPPVFVSKSEQVRASGTTALSVTAPTSISDGNTLYLVVWAATTTGAAATCSGFTQVYFNNSANPTITILKKTAASESGSYSVASTTSSAAGAQMFNYSGGIGSEDVVGTIDRSGGTTATNVASSITATADGVLLAFFHQASASGRTVSTPPSGMTQRAFDNSTANVDMAAYELTPSPAGATGTKTLVWSGTAVSHGAILMQIK